MLPYGCAGLAKFGKSSVVDGPFDNNNPREWLAMQTQWRARANHAQANGFEALPFFIGAVIIAHQLGAPQGRLDLLAFFFIILRVFYSMAYVAGLPGLRSGLWVAAFAVNLMIFLIGYR